MIAFMIIKGNIICWHFLKALPSADNLHFILREITVYFSDEVFSLKIWGHFIQQCTQLKYGNNLSPKIWAPLPTSSDGPSPIMLTCCTFLFVSNTITINNNHVFSSKQGCENCKINLLQGLISKIPGTQIFL